MTVEVARQPRRRATTPKKKTEPDVAATSEVEPAPDATPVATPSFAYRAPAMLQPSASVYRAAAPLSAVSGPMAIGEIEQTLFDCPKCARPLALGARRCPGCGSRLVNGVALGKASMFVAVGLLVGLLTGGGGGLAIGLARAGGAAPAANGPAASGAPSTAPSTAPTATVAPSASLPAPTPVSTVPSIARSALGQVAGLSTRFRTARTDLRAALAAPTFDATTVAQILRTISSDTNFGAQVATNASAWTGNPIGSRLATFYDGIHAVAATGLEASVRNEAAYRSAATAMVRLLDGVDEVDAAVAAAAAAGGFALPPAPAAP
jgi:hypothetical protein